MKKKTLLVSTIILLLLSTFIFTIQIEAAPTANFHIYKFN